MIRSLTCFAIVFALLLASADEADAQYCPRVAGNVALNTTPGPGGQAINQTVCSSSGNCFMICKYGSNPSLPEFQAVLEWRPADQPIEPVYPGTCTPNRAPNYILSATRQALVSWTPGFREDAAAVARGIFGVAEAVAAPCPGAAGAGSGSVATPRPPPPPQLPPPPTFRVNRPPVLASPPLWLTPVSPTMDDWTNLDVSASDPEGDAVHVRVTLRSDRHIVRVREGTIPPGNPRPGLNLKFPPVNAFDDHLPWGDYTADIELRDDDNGWRMFPGVGKFTVRRPIVIIWWKDRLSTIVRDRRQQDIWVSDPGPEVAGNVLVRLYEGDAVQMCARGERANIQSTLRVSWPAENTWADVVFEPRGSPTLCYTMKFAGTRAETSGPVHVLAEIAQMGADALIDHRLETFVQRHAGSVGSNVLTVISFLEGADSVASGAPTVVEVRSEILLTHTQRGLTMKVFEGSPAVHTASGRVPVAPGEQIDVGRGGVVGARQAFSPSSVVRWWAGHAEPDLAAYRGSGSIAPARRDITTRSYPSGPLPSGDGSVSFANGAFLVRSAATLFTSYVVATEAATNFQAQAAIAASAPAGRTPVAGLYLARSPTVASVTEGDLFFGRADGSARLFLRRADQWEDLPLAPLVNASADGFDQIVIHRRGDAYEFHMNGQILGVHALPGRPAERVDFYVGPGAEGEMRRWEVTTW